jgi:tetratricopeptide (TPR) repeat protein
MFKCPVAGKFCKRAWLIAWAQSLAMAGAAPAGAQDREPVREEASDGQGGDRVDGEPDTAHDEEARARFAAARLAYADGRFDDALEDFKRAYALSRRPELLFNVGSAADRLRRDQEALEAYEAYLKQVPDADNRRFIEARVRLLRERIADEDRRAAEREVPTPQEAASASPLVVASQTGDEPRDTGERRVFSRWWFWTGVAAVVVAGVLTGVLVSRSSSSSDPFVGSDGQAHETLSVGRW